MSIVTKALATVRRLVAPALVVAASVTVAAATPQPAGAAVSRCSAGQVCLYKHSNYEGGYANYFGNDISYSDNRFDGCPTLSGCELNDSVSSIDNDGERLGTRHFMHYFGAADNPFLKIRRGGYRATLGSFNDELTAHRWE